MTLFAKQSLMPNVLILGAGMRAAKLYQELVEPEYRIPCSIKGFVPLEEQDSALPEHLVLSSADTLAALARKLQITEIVIVQDDPAQSCPMQELLSCKLAGIELSSLDSFLAKVHENSDLPEAEYDALLVNYH